MGRNIQHADREDAGAWRACVATVKQMGGGATVQLTLIAVAYNFKRALFLVRRDAAQAQSYA